VELQEVVVGLEELGLHMVLVLHPVHMGLVPHHMQEVAHHMQEVLHHMRVEEHSEQACCRIDLQK
jgi:hypothetical protein